mgnify:CR=1 FL=1
MSTQSDNNRRVAKNTIMLYMRMMVLMLIGLYTSRVILQSLGVENYGINNVIAGFLSMFGILTSSMSSSISRFITVELGKGNIGRLERNICRKFNFSILKEEFSRGLFLILHLLVEHILSVNVVVLSNPCRI